MMAHAGHRGRIIAPTLGDAWEACVIGPSGVKAHNPDVDLNSNKGIITWPNGSRARIFGAKGPDDVERLRAGGNSHIDWYEELAAWVKLDEAWDQARFGLRLGDNPRSIITTTPKPRKVLKTLLKDSRSIIARTADGRIPSTLDNPHLSSSVRADLLARYQGTRIGRQELYGELLEDVPGALWKQEYFQYWPEDQDLPPMRRIVVAIDPAVTNTEDSDQTGIVAAGIGLDGRGYVLADVSGYYSPHEWALQAIGLYRALEADRIVAEVNNGGDMVELTIRTVDPLVPYTAVRASRGKLIRAEPIAALYEQRKVIHALQFAELEEQCQTYVPDSSQSSPDRLDALVWALTELMLDSPSIASETTLVATHRSS
jgi:phage terminase large subunit-like protein